LGSRGLEELNNTKEGMEALPERSPTRNSGFSISVAAWLIPCVIFLPPLAEFDAHFANSRPSGRCATPQLKPFTTRLGVITFVRIVFEIDLLFFRHFSPVEMTPPTKVWLRVASRGSIFFGVFFHLVSECASDSPTLAPGSDDASDLYGLHGLLDSADDRFYLVKDF
jgi:hypothetical protein